MGLWVYGFCQLNGYVDEEWEQVAQQVDGVESAGQKAPILEYLGQCAHEWDDAGGDDFMFGRLPLQQTVDEQHVSRRP